ncbi:DTW domain-containing protein [Vibrio aquaticus]|uniref:tRNA-uridine aminocarboxypropyltransferase n=1 Tax=Vibrio aquaticus TaxID=2496559 RepID=A0A3S0MLA8_9VIBR|nr:DTW domain-containing protein [Vibrio aquaticus]RTZ13816.1 DTW domain-containing protein [Vibrio aquaticus]
MSDTCPPSTCPQCQLRFQCVCEQLPKLDSSIHFALLIHENEQNRETNTGQWLLKSMPSTTSVHIWQRKSPCPKLVALLENPRYQAYLLFPGDESIEVTRACAKAGETQTLPLFIVLDGTWQEAKKMLRKSPWLQSIPLAHVTPSKTSNYQLRRNQEEGHLCTLEVGCEVLSAVGEKAQSEQLLQFFDHYMLAFKADKSGHSLKS